MAIQGPAVASLCVAVFAVSGPVLQDWERGYQRIRRVLPASVASMPKPIRDDLTRRGCTIPQTYASRGTHNIIRGHFLTRVQTDIAVLCSIGDSSTILVYPGGGLRDVKEVATGDDRGYLQTTGGPEEVGYSRAIGVAAEVDLQRAPEAPDEQTPPSITHDGIDDAYIEKGSNVWYWTDGRWVRLRGSD